MGKKYFNVHSNYLKTIKNTVHITGFRYTTARIHVDFCHRDLRNVYFINTEIYTCL